MGERERVERYGRVGELPKVSRQTKVFIDECPAEARCATSGSRWECRGQGGARQHEELGREGELAFMCLVRLFTSLLPASSRCLPLAWNIIENITERGPVRSSEMVVGGTWRQRAWDDPWREKVTSLTVIGSSSSEVMCS